MMDEEYKQEVERLVDGLLVGNPEIEFSEVYRQTHGADPRLVFDSYSRRDKAVRTREPRGDGIKETYETVSLPQSDPLKSQWWFRQDSVALLANKCRSLVGAADKAIFVGTPTVAQYYSYAFGPAILLDADQQVIDAVEMHAKSNSQLFDVADELPGDLIDSCDVAVVDPPWYPDDIKLFLSRAAAAVSRGGSILCSLPPRLTRPAIEHERAELTRWAMEHDLELVSLEPQKLSYLVPQFESYAFHNVHGFDHRPWRFGDLMHLRNFSGPIDVPKRAKTEYRTFSRDPMKFRIFLRKGLRKRNSGDWISLSNDFSDNVSTRSFAAKELEIWTSSNCGGRVRDPELTRLALESWEQKHDRQQTIATLSKNRESSEAESIVDELEASFALWKEHPCGPIPENFATKGNTDSRPYHLASDGYRDQFGRDRDRIIWSNALRSLANKKQVFLTDEDGNVRQRLTHTLEVMQLSKTIGESLNLNPKLIEAGALAHDIGHTPFGHAGEHALDQTINEISPELGGFNHYEHGLDVVRWLEDAYLAPVSGSLPGLNLSSEVSECILKHSFAYGGHASSQTELHARSKHSSYIDNRYAHLEGQSIRIADKVSYLVSDLEDGIRLGVFTLEDLQQCHLFNRPPIDLWTGEASLYARFLGQRRFMLKLLMEDIISETRRRLVSLKSVDDVREGHDYTVAYSRGMQNDVDEVWKRLQAGILHKDARVIMSNVQSAKIVRQLFVVFAYFPDLVDPQFRRQHAPLQNTEYFQWYKERVGVSIQIPEHLRDFLPRSAIIGRRGGMDRVLTEQLILAKDFVATLTDTTAKTLHRKYVVSN